MDPSGFKKDLSKAKNTPLPPNGTDGDPGNLEEPMSSSHEDSPSHEANAIDQLVEMLKQVKWEDVPDAIKERIRENPKMTIFQVFALILPAVLTGPLLGLLGFSATGPVAGSAAAGFQSTFGTNFAFRIAQSAAMGGYGAPVVTGVTSASSFVSAAIAETFKTTKGENMDASSEGVLVIGKHCEEQAVKSLPRKPQRSLL
ncbi:hypothetical protein K431DRAFT_305193 [Polychaeton citri CBS 116435]|uniref:Uncharacterized protein n=1 Tax=Polychaeton citri CBS 116435 TaxID=1314669 RepID=A0A9P4Q4K7_9PEZI|nr:hypothetical protein K431DRAFT_305193 [Polychaeton citri CBS 116435]